jgi:hypothetical protein
MAPIERPECPGDGTESDTDRKAAGHIRGVMDLHVHAAEGDKATEAEDRRLQGATRFLGEEYAGDHGRAGVTTRETSGERDAHLVGARFLNDGSFAFELALDYPIDDHRLDAEGCCEAPCGTRIFLGPETAGEGQQHPDQTEVAELGEGVHDPVGRFGAANLVEPAVDKIVEAGDGAENMGWLGQFCGNHGVDARGALLLPRP